MFILTIIWENSNKNLKMSAQYQCLTVTKVKYNVGASSIYLNPMTPSWAAARFWTGNLSVIGAR